MIKAIFFDLDGTLLDHHSKLSPKTVELIKKLSQNYLIFIATGRSFVKSVQYYRQLGLKHEIINGNGGHIHNPTDPSSFPPIVNYLSPDLVQKLLKRLEPLVSNVILENDKDMVFRHFDPSLAPYFSYETASQNAIDWPNIPLVPVTVVVKAKNGQEKTITEIIENEFPNLRIHFWHDFPMLAEIIDDKTSKYLGIKKILDHYQLTFKEILFFGDSSNDKEVLVNAGLGIAMLNAHDDIKRKAQRISKVHANTEGVYHELLLLLQEGILNI